MRTRSYWGFDCVYWEFVVEDSLFLEDKMSSTTSEGGGKLLHVFVLIVVSCWVCVCFFCVWLTRKICCWVCVFVLVLVGNQFVFVFLCLVDKKGQENARKFGHVFFV